jgi:hypothetical protein
VLFRAERLIDVGDLKLVARRGSDVGRDGAPTSAPSIAEALSAILARSASATELVKDFAAAKWPRSSRQLRQLARFCERNPRGIEGEGTAREGQRGSRDHDEGFSDQGRTPGQFAARSVAPAPGVRRRGSRRLGANSMSSFSAAKTAYNRWAAVMSFNGQSSLNCTGTLWLYFEQTTVRLIREAIHAILLLPRFGVRTITRLS